MARIIICLLAIAVLSASAQASLVYYLDIEGVQGESQIDPYQDWIEVNSFGVDVRIGSPSAPGDTRPSGEVIFSEFVFSGVVSKASPKIFESVVMGTPIPIITLDIVRIGAERDILAQWELKDALLTSYQTASSPGNTLPVETYSAVFSEIKYTYNEYASDGRALGSVQFEWDLLAGTSGSAFTGTVESFEFLTGTIPEPAALSLLTLGGFVLIRRRK